MSQMNLFKSFLVSHSLDVIKIDCKDTDHWLLNKHYARRKCQRTHCFALTENNKIHGVVTYGMPPSPNIAKGFLGDGFNKRVLELNRLIINSDAPKNAASILVGRSLKKLPKCAVVSYADGFMGHVGYVYQATNFIYVGETKSHDKEYFIDGKWVHAKVLTNRGISAPAKWAKENSINTRPPHPKHRYIYFTDKSLKKHLKYPKKPYPKGDSRKYECDDIYHEVAL